MARLLKYGKVQIVPISLDLIRLVLLNAAKVKELSIEDFCGRIIMIIHF
jgi:hypothetical protein